MKNQVTEVVHTIRCYKSGIAVPWNYADDLTFEQVTAETMKLGWLHLCRICLRGRCQCEECR